MRVPLRNRTPCVSVKIACRKYVLAELPEGGVETGNGITSVPPAEILPAWTTRELPPARGSGTIRTPLHAGIYTAGLEATERRRVTRSPGRPRNVIDVAAPLGTGVVASSKRACPGSSAIWLPD